MNVSFLYTLAKLPLVLLLASLPAFAQASRLQLPQMEKLAARASEVVNVTLDGNTLKLATQFLDDNAEAREVSSLLKGIYVRSFEFDKTDEYSPADVEAIRTALTGPGWDRVVNVASKRKGSVDVYIHADGRGGSRGLVVISAEPKELVVVHIDGNIDLKKLRSLEGKMGIPKLDMEKKGSKSGERHDAK